MRMLIVILPLLAGCYDFVSPGDYAVWGADGTPLGDPGPWEPALADLLGDWALVVKQGNGDRAPALGTALGSRPPREVLADEGCRPAAIAVPPGAALDPGSFSYWGFVVDENGDCPVYAPVAREGTPALSRVIRTVAVGSSRCDDAALPTGALVFLGDTGRVVRAAWLPFRASP